MATKAEKLIEVLEPLAEGNGLELVTVEVAGTKKNPILRVCLDTPQGGINLDQLAEAREWVDAAVDELDPFKESFVLEVSSPGIDRPLRKLSDFERFVGEDVVVDQDGQPLAIPFATIKRAHIVGRIDFSGSGSKNVD